EGIGALMRRRDRLDIVERLALHSKETQGHYSSTRLRNRKIQEIIAV
ncbi:hypothetical protein CEXT_656881, partial [Caerostris extrusa]